MECSRGLMACTANPSSSSSSVSNSLQILRRSNTGLQHSRCLGFNSRPAPAPPLRAQLVSPPSFTSSVSLLQSDSATASTSVSSMEQLISSLQSSIGPVSESERQSLCSPSSRDSSSWDENIPLWKSAQSFTGAGRGTEWNPFQRIVAGALDTIEKRFIPMLEGDHLPSTADPELQLQGNFAPVSECPVSGPLPVRAGQIPADLQGLYIRNGANPRFKPVAGHHLFDGDGMLHGVLLKDESASYCARFTHTNRLKEEERLGRAFFPKPIGELHGHAGLARLILFHLRASLGLVNAEEGIGPANAGVVFFDGKLLAMSEDDQPYAVKIEADGDVKTLGRYDFHGQLGSSMLAHPKKDPRTGELFNLSYDIIKRPFVRYFSFASDGSKQADVEIPVAEPTMIHDFAITENYVVVPDQQVVFRLQRMLSGQSPVVYDPEKKSRFGVLPKYGAEPGDIRWVEVPDCFCLHVWNAWEDGNNQVVVLASVMTPPDCIFNEHEQEMSSVLCEIRLDLSTGTSTRTPIADLNLEAGTVNKYVLGRKSRFLYLAVAEPWPRVSGIAKIDLSRRDQGDCVIGRHQHGDDCFGGEPFFVPRSSDPDAAEDDGYVLTYVHNETSGESELRILDASTDNLDLIAAVKLPSRVPYGFHGTFVSQEDLSAQHA